MNQPLLAHHKIPVHDSTIESHLGCDGDHPIRGVLFPADIYGDYSRAWITRCDYCQFYEDDEQAAAALKDQEVIEDFDWGAIFDFEGEPFDLYVFELGSIEPECARDEVEMFPPPAVAGSSGFIMPILNVVEELGEIQVIQPVGETEGLV